MKNVPISKSIPYNIDENYLELTRKVHLILHVGRLMMENSADTSRIVRTMQRTAAYAGIFGDQLHIHVTYTTLMVSVSVGNYHMTKLQKCYQHNVDMNVILEVSKMTWEAIERDYTIEQFEAELKKVESKKSKYATFIINLGAALACGGVGKMFGCDIMASLYTALAAFIGFFVRSQCLKIGINPYMAIVLSSFTATVIAYFTHFLPFTDTSWYTMLACAIFIVPGVPMVHALEDMLDCYITAGITRAMNTLLMVGSMTFGIIFAIKLFSVEDFTHLSTVNHQAYIVYVISAFIAAAGFSTMFNVPPRLLWVVGLGGVISVCVRTLSMDFLGVGLPIGTLLGAMVVSIIALRAVHWFHVPSHVLTIPSVIPLMPGILMYRLLFNIIDIDTLDVSNFLQAFQSGVNATLIILAIAVGVALPNIFAQKYIRIYDSKRLSRALSERKYRQYHFKEIKQLELFKE